MKKTQHLRKKRIQKGLIVMGIILIIISLFIIIFRTISGESYRQVVKDEDNPIPRPDFDVMLLTPNEYSRPGLKIGKINAIVIHYTANPGSSAKNNRDYFEGLKNSHITKASSHFIVGLKGEVVQCIPTSEYSYASNSRNKDTISIETCYKNDDGSYEKATYKSMVNLTAWLLVKFGLDTDDIIRHYDITGKICPK